MPVCADPVSKSKLRQFENLLDLKEYSQILDRTVKMNLPFYAGEA